MKGKFKETEVGLIPEDWEVKKLGDVFNISAGGDLDKKCFSNTQDDKFNYAIFSNALSNKGLYGYTSEPKHKPKSITITARGEIGNANFRDQPFTAIGRVLVLEENTSISGIFVSEYVNKFVNFANESTGVPQLTAPQVSKYNIPLPPTLAEQEAIAEVLSDTDALITSLETTIQKKKLLKQGAMQELLTGKRRLPGFGWKGGMKDTEVGSIPEDWEVKKLGDVGNTFIGLTYKPSDVKEHGILVLRSSNIQENKLAFHDNVFVEMELPTRVIVKKNDILICVRNGSKNLIGKCALIDKKTEGSAFGAFMSIFRSKISKFIFHQFQSEIIQRQIDELMGATINQITNRNFSEFKVPLPPTLAEQEAIAIMLSEMDEEIEGLDKKLEKTKGIKQGLMQVLLKGKIRLV
ncbi:type I restriction enzyme S subunit [Leptospira meyeri]|uniref:Type I restriction enzyme S subunit n=1 Tax=Leptospira meyeri TaxID=29508 RepID=A0A4R8MPS4_LEPME|nr:restriction endonuclease subunit S [Leptospira meyeri]EKJ85604.1 type I restriction modification DNA specificity domain protein [Leptospira meyeri serovar Hardjo str. Went 5]TDY71349.1 type I restriction enzyme S subunit [Leptospira meyeri]